MENYEQKKIIGRGGFSIVYSAFDKINKRKVALKIIEKSNDIIIDYGEDNFKKLIANEIKISKICKSNSIVELYDSFETEKEFVLVFELCDTDLKKFLNQLGPLKYKKPEIFIRLFINLIDSVSILHEHSVIHRDIKPSNILIKYENNTPIFKLSDLGISQIYDGKENFYEMGTLQYMAPEILKGLKYDFKCDIFSLGVTLYEAYSGYHPTGTHDKFDLYQFYQSGKKMMIEDCGNFFSDFFRKLLQINPCNRVSYLELIDIKKKLKELEKILNNGIGIIGNNISGTNNKLNLLEKDIETLNSEIIKNDKVKDNENIIKKIETNTEKIQREKNNLNKIKNKKEKIEKEIKIDTENIDFKNMFEVNNKIENLSEELNEALKKIDDEIEKIKKKNEEIKEDIKKCIYIFGDLEKIKNIGSNLFDMMTFPNLYDPKNKQEKNKGITNIIYYDENIDKYLEYIHTDSDLFEEKTLGSFFLCTNEKSLKILLYLINQQFLIDNNKKFNLIVTGSKYEKVINILNSNEDNNNDKYIKCIENICIYCMDVDKYLHYQKENNKVKLVTKNTKNVLHFIDSSKNIKTVPLICTKLLKFFDYKEKYFERHEKIAQYYGDLTIDTYNSKIKKMQKIINESKTENKKKLLEAFMTFKIEEDIKNIEQLNKQIEKEKTLITVYTTNGLYKDLNKWLRMFGEENVYETIAYFTSRLMNSLNNYGLKSKYYYRKNKTLYRGYKANYYDLLPFERAKGKVVILTSFNSFSEDEKVAKDFSSRNESNQLKKGYFSVIYYLTNKIENESIPCGVDIHKISEYENEREVLFHPFTFCYCEDAVFDYNKQTVDIYLKILSKYEILEEEIKPGLKAKLTSDEKIVYVNDKIIKAIEKENDKEKINDKPSKKILKK